MKFLKKRHHAGAVLLGFCILSSVLIFAGCRKSKAGPAIIWTNQVEFVSYAELFNTVQEKYRVVVEYKENPTELLPILTEDKPDLIVGPWLKNEKKRNNFISLDYLFDDLLLSRKIFYPGLLEQGSAQDRQYLIPVSFNIPSVIFSSDNLQLIPDNFMLSLDQIKAAGSAFNRKSPQGIFTAMGFSPRWTPEFLYIAAMLKQVNFQESETVFSWDPRAFQDTISYLRAWTTEVNDSVTAEDDFQFKYLYSPSYKLVTSGRSLFAYMRSDDLFELPRERLQNIEFRWMQEDGFIPVIDETIYMGLYRKASHTEAAEAFITWFFSESSQKALMDRSEKMGVLNRNFGISGGFSSIKSVNERVFPSYYPLLLGHLPPTETLLPPGILPKRWKKIKEKIIIPYLKDAVAADKGQSIVSLETRIADWIKQN